MAAKIESASDLRARIGWIILCAPDRFPTSGSFSSDQSKNLLLAFDIVRSGLPIVERKIKNPEQCEMLNKLLKDALSAYQEGENKNGAHLLQDFLDLVFPKRFEEYEERKGDNAP